MQYPSFRLFFTVNHSLNFSLIHAWALNTDGQSVAVPQHVTSHHSAPPPPSEQICQQAPSATTASPGHPDRRLRPFASATRLDQLSQFRRVLRSGAARYRRRRGCRWGCRSGVWGGTTDQAAEETAGREGAEGSAELAFVFAIGVVVESGSESESAVRAEKRAVGVVESRFVALVGRNGGFSAGEMVDESSGGGEWLAGRRVGGRRIEDT